MILRKAYINGTCDTKFEELRFVADLISFEMIYQVSALG